MFGRFAWGAALAGLAAIAQAQSAFEDPPASGATPAKVTFEFATLRSRVRPGDPIGHVHSGLFCHNVVETHAVAQIDQNTDSNGRRAFNASAKEIGIPLFEHELSPFGTDASDSADYRVGGVLQRLAFELCPDGAKRSGSVEVEVKWEVYSTKLQRVVMTKTTVGDFKSDDDIAGNFELQAYDKSAVLLLVSDDFKALAAGRAPTVGAVAQPPLHLPGGARVEGNSQAQAQALRQAVVTIVSDAGSGTGFYIADGYLLTDRHVVGSSKYVKVELSTGKSLVGEVVRQDAPRDVALLHTESAGVPTLRVDLADPPIGASMFAIGSPLGDRLAGTFTRGVLSGVRDDHGTRFLQSDVAINPGNSGGPMLDANSHVVGLADFIIRPTSGLSFFVPIKDALDRLAVVIDDRPAVP